MTEMYFKLVINHKRTCNPENKEVKLVPVNYRKEVSSLLTDKGYDLDGNVIA